MTKVVGASGFDGTQAHSTVYVLLYCKDNPNEFRDCTLNWYICPETRSVTVKDFVRMFA